MAAQYYYSHRSMRTQWRYLRVIFVLTLVLLIWLACSDTSRRHVASLLGRVEYSRHETILAAGPPKYKALREWEKNLPQHRLDLPAPEGRHGRYVKFSNQIRLLGWNNCFAELQLSAYLAYLSRRTYVFQEYIWAPEHYTWPEEQFLEWPPRTPLNALISGPIAGGPWEAGDNTPRSIHESWFDIVCPVEERRIIWTNDVKPLLEDAPGDEVLAVWKKILFEAPERCVEIKGSEGASLPQTFDLNVLGGSRILPLWEGFSKSAVSRLWDSSPIVKSAMYRNEYLFLPRGPKAEMASRNPYERMLSMHLRRGDFEGHCRDLADWRSAFFGWCNLPFLPDATELSSISSDDPKIHSEYLKHCYPTFDDVIHKVNQSRLDYAAASREGKPRTLDILYILTNGQGAWLEELKETLRAQGWNTIVTSRDLILDQEQTDVSMAVDMEIARQSAVFIGNGWSSFTSNVVHKRLVDGKERVSIRFF